MVLFDDISLYLGFPDSSVGKESACNVGDPGSIPGLARYTHAHTHTVINFIDSQTLT